MPKTTVPVAAPEPASKASARAPRRSRREPALPFPVEGWDKADLKGFDRDALAEEGEGSMRGLGFIKLSSAQSHHSSFSRRDGKLDEFSLWEHPAGILAHMSTTTGGFTPAPGRARGEYDPAMRRVNAIQWFFQLLNGCGREAMAGLGQSGGSGGAMVAPDGSWAEQRSCSMQGNARQVVGGIQAAGRIIPLGEWLHEGGMGGLYLPSQLWMGLEGGRERDGEGDPEAPSAESRSQMLKEWLGALPEGARMAIEASEGEGGRGRRRRIDDVGPYLARCVGAAGRRWTSEAEKALHPIWRDWIGDPDGVEAIPQDDACAFKVSDCGATLLQCLLSDIAHERTLRLALGYVQGAPLAQLARVANAVDARGSTAGMRCFELCAAGARPEEAAAVARVFDALAARLGPRLKMKSPRASAMGLLFSEADRPHRGIPWANDDQAIDAIFMSASRHGVAWEQGGLRCPHPTQMVEGGDRKLLPAWEEARQAKALPAVALLLGEIGSLAAKALVEAKELSLCAGVKKTTLRKAPFSL